MHVTFPRSGVDSRICCAYDDPVGISAKIWPISDADIAKCLAVRGHINTLFHAAEDYAKIWGARDLHATLERLMHAGIGLEIIDRSDPTYALRHAALKALLERGTDAIVHTLVQPEPAEVGGGSAGDIVDLAVRALNANLGICYCIFEDW